MTKSEIVNAVMSTFANVQNVEIGEELGNVTITVTTDLLRADEQYELRDAILQRLEPERPVGVGFDVQVKRFDDGTMVAFGTAGRGPTNRVEIFTSAAEVMESFGYKRTVVQRTRFEAIAEELIAHISPVKKQPPSAFEPKLNVPRIFEQAIEVKPNGVLSPCPNCKCLAFEPNSSKDRVICRGCPLPSPVFTLVYGDRLPFTQRKYKCCSCGRDSTITMEMKEINLYCSGCSKLSLHELQVQRVFSGSKATFTFNNVVVGEASLAEMFREKLGLLPHKMYAVQQRNENIVQRELKEKDLDRRTGRTTREMLLSIARFMVSDMRFFSVVGHTERYTKDLANLARDMHEQLNLARAMTIKPIFPNDFDPSYDYMVTQRALVYVDHTWGERANR